MSQSPKASKKHLKDIFSNIGWLTGLHLFKMATNFFVGVMVARYLGSDQFGYLGYAISWSYILVPFTLNSINGMIIREIKMQPKEVGRILTSAWLLRMLSSTLTFVVFCLVMLVGFRQVEHLVLTLTVACTLLFYPFNVIESWFMSQSQAKPIAISNALVFVVATVARLFALFTGMDVLVFGIIFSVELASGFVVPMILIKKYHIPLLMPTKKWMYYFTKYSAKLIVANLIGTVERQVDKMMIFHLLGPAMAGQYEVLTRLINMMGFVRQSIRISVLPNMVETYKNNLTLFYQKMKKLYLYLSLLGAGMGAGVALLGSYAILTVYGEQYRVAAEAFPYFSIYFVLMFFMVSLGTYLDCTKYYDFWIISSPITIVSNVLFNWYMIPIIGVKGAVIATQISLIIGTFVVGFSLKKTRTLYYYVLGIKHI